MELSGWERRNSITLLLRRVFTEFNGFGMSTLSAPGGASAIVAATKWRQERSLSPLRGFRNMGGHFLWTYVHSYTLSPLSWLVCRTQGKATAIRSLSQSSDDGEADSCDSTFPKMWHCSIPATKFRDEPFQRGQNANLESVLELDANFTFEDRKTNAMISNGDRVGQSLAFLAGFNF